jgi:UDP-N-acetylglucosamine:LPS N-acetylglucosamine transferase
MEEKKVTPENFQEKIFSMLANRKSLKKSAENSHRKIVLGGEKRIVQEILILLNYKEHPELSFK